MLHVRNYNSLLKQLSFYGYDYFQNCSYLIATTGNTIIVHLKSIWDEQIASVFLYMLLVSVWILRAVLQLQPSYAAHISSPDNTDCKHHKYDGRDYSTQVYPVGNPYQQYRTWAIT